jgi:hypothetical protein
MEATLVVFASLLGFTSSLLSVPAVSCSCSSSLPSATTESAKLNGGMGRGG